MQSKSHPLGTTETNRTPLLCFDGERCTLDDGIKTLAYGHKHIE